jgi:hypothetical protein
MNTNIRHNNSKTSNEMAEPENTVENPFKEFLRLKKELMKERAGLVERIQQINTVLNAQEFYDSKTANIKFRPQHKVQTPRNTMTLKAAVIMITRRRPLTKEEILVELEEVGYEFATPKPMNSLNTTLYAKGVFKNENGRFSPTESTLEEYYP